MNFQANSQVYNYWEPLHFLAHGKGLQTWEYAPEFAIRSWAYIILHLPPVLLAKFLLPLDKRAQFLALRIVFSLVSSFIECKLYRAISEHINPRIGRYFLLLSMGSAGMWGASTAFLPSSFSLHLTNLAFSHAIAPVDDNYTRTFRATLCFASSAIVGWPFAVLLAMPFVLEELLLRGNAVAYAFPKRLWRLSSAGIVSLLFLSPTILIDSYFYNKFVFVPLNIIKYNLFSTSGGPTLYGTEPWHYYIVNGVLNFNVAFGLALFALPLLAVATFIDKAKLRSTPNKTSTSPALLVAFRLAAFNIWFIVLSLQAHKEERFMFPAYGFICFNAAVSLYLARQILGKVIHSVSPASQFLLPNLSITILSFFIVFSIARIAAMQYYYRAPEVLLQHFTSAELPRLTIAYNPSLYPALTEDLALFHHTPTLQEITKLVARSTERVDLTLLADLNLTVCYGAEWYRFPSQFALPTVASFAFVKSGFDGILPRPFEFEGKSRRSAASRTGLPFNDRNQEELDRYVELSECSYLVDFVEPDSTLLQPDFNKDWEKALCLPFLSSSKSQRLTRALYFPVKQWRDANVFGDYCLFKSKKLP